MCRMFIFPPSSLKCFNAKGNSHGNDFYTIFCNHISNFYKTGVAYIKIGRGDDHALSFFLALVRIQPGSAPELTDYYNATNKEGNQRCKQMEAMMVN